MKQKNWRIVSLPGVFVIGILCGYLISKSTINKTAAGKKPETEFVDIQKNELSIYPDFFDVDSLVYNNDHLTTKIKLTEKGKLYNTTNLFSNQYTVTVALINNESEEPYIIFDEIIWDINKDLNVDVAIDLNEITDKGVLADFNKQLNEMKNGSDHNIQYNIEVVPKNNPNNIMRTIGMLHEKK